MRCAGQTVIRITLINLKIVKTQSHDNESSLGTVYATFHAIKRRVRKDWPRGAKIKQGCTKVKPLSLLFCCIMGSSEPFYRPGRGNFREAKV